MRILHFADFHLGVETYGRIDPATGLSSRLADFLAALDQLVDYALENHVDLVLFCGDAYKTREPTQTQQREFARRISRLASSNIPVFLLVGNHDLPNAIGRATTTEIFDTLAVKNVYVSNRPEILKIPTPSGPVQVVSLPWVRRSLLLSKEETKDLNFDQLKDKLQQALSNIVSVNAEKLDPSLPTVLAGHVWVANALVGSEKLMTLGQEHALLVSNLALPAFDYVALGHIHKHQVLWDSPPVVYAGSLERVDFGEEGDEKGFYIVDIEKGPKRQTTFTFHALKVRPFVTLSLTLDPQDADPTTTVLKYVAAQSERVKEAIVRLMLTVPAEIEGQLRDSEIRNALKEAHHATIAREVKREARLRLGGLTAEGMSPAEALKLYLASKKTPPERAKVLLEYGERLIQGTGL